MHIFFHNDLDGQGSGHVIHDATKKNIVMVTPSEEVKYHSIHYAARFPIEEIGKDERVWIVDFSIPVDDMQVLLERTTHVIWIDHHMTSIATYGGVRFPALVDNIIPGMRVDGRAGCVLTYMYIHNCEYEDVPEYIRLIGDRDVWKFEYGQRTKDFCMGIGVLDLKPTSRDWEKAKLAIDHYIEVGSGINMYLTNWYSSYNKSWGYETEFEGHTCFVVNGKFPADASDEITKKYDIAITTVYDGGVWTITFYSRKEIDVSEIAKKYGGGGHFGAAGCTLKELPFMKKGS